MSSAPAPSTFASGQDLDVAALANSLIPVTIGNLLGGSVFVALVCWIVNLRGGGTGAG